MQAWDIFLLWVAAPIAWFAGETGRVLVAGGAGGLVRWLTQEKRRMRDGVISIMVGGPVSAYYLWPLVLAILGFFTGPIEQTSTTITMAAFVAGTFGISGVKIMIAVVEKRALNLGNGGSNDMP